MIYKDFVLENHLEKLINNILKKCRADKEAYSKADDRDSEFNQIKQNSIKLINRSVGNQKGRVSFCWVRAETLCHIRYEYKPD